MPTAAEIIADPSLRSQCVWVFLSLLPDDFFAVEDLAQWECQIPRIPFTGEVLDAGEIPMYYLLRQHCLIGPLPDGSSGEVESLVLLWPGNPPELLALAELRGGYLMATGDTLTTTLVALVPRY